VIGELQIPDVGDAVLGDDGVWTSDVTNLAVYLNGEYDPSRAEGLAAILPFGAGAIMDAARDLEGEFKLVEPIKPLLSLSANADWVQNWCNQYGGTTCKDGAGGSTAKDKKTAPPPGDGVHDPNVEHDRNNDGVTESARVGVHGMKVPDKIGKLPNLTKRERQVETSFRKAYEKNPDKMAGDYRVLVAQTTKPGEPRMYETDGAKNLADAWTHPDQSTRAENRATLNTPLHQVANAVAKRAFLHDLDSLKEGDEILVTVGGCGAGKGYALKNVPEALDIKGRCKLGWDSAGDQNATENPWIQREADKRGIKVNYVFVHTDPYKQWGDPDKGVLKRAADPKDGRMVDAKVFADSYAIGAKNHQAFYESHRNNPNASFTFIDNSTKPTKIDGIPKEALTIDRHELADFAASHAALTAPPHVVRGATMHARIWPKEKGRRR